MRDRRGRRNGPLRMVQGTNLSGVKGGDEEHGACDGQGAGSQSGGPGREVPHQTRDGDASHAWPGKSTSELLSQLDQLLPPEGRWGWIPAEWSLAPAPLPGAWSSRSTPPKDGQCSLAF